MAHIEEDVSACERELDDDCESIITGARYDYIARLCGACYKKKNTSETTSDKIDRIVTNRVLGLPIFDTAFAFIRRIAHGQSPMHADRGHIHHRLIDMGLNQKQAVATLYVISAMLGLSAVVLTTSGVTKAMLFLASLCVAGGVAAMLFLNRVNEEDSKK